MKPNTLPSDILNEARALVEGAHLKLLIDVAAPYWGIRERILKKAKSLIPADVAGPYRKFWEGQVGIIVETPVLYEPLQETCKKVENDMLAALADKSPSPKQRKKVLDFVKETGPLKILEQMWPALIDLRYEYFTESALKILRRVDLYKPHGPIFEGSTILTSAFQYAMDIDDLNFFARVGDVLRKRQEKLGALFEPLTKPPVLHQFLLKHWAQGHNGIPPLCNLSVEELTEVCRTRLRNKSLTHDAVAKTKQRLGLISTRSIPAK